MKRPVPQRPRKSARKRSQLSTLGLARRAALRRKAHRVAERLHVVYGSPHHGNKPDPVDEIVFILLSQMTTHHSFNRVFERLKREVRAWGRLPGTPMPRLKELIKDAGLSGQKAPRLKLVMRRLERDFGRVTLAPLHDMETPEAQAYLESLPGIGTKSAKCVLMYSFGREVLPVDTHVWRVARRIGLVGDNVPYARVHEELEAAVAPGDRFSVHVNAIVHGRRVCLPRWPRCPQCPIARSCEWYRGQLTPG